MDLKSIFGGGSTTTTANKTGIVDTLRGAISNPFSLLGKLPEIGAYIKEHTTKMNNPTNIFASWKRDDETGRQPYIGKEPIDWTNNDGDQPENEANAVLMYIQWKGNLDWAKNKVTSDKLRKKLRKTDLTDDVIESLCYNLDELNGTVKRANLKAETVVQQPRNNPRSNTNTTGTIKPKLNYTPNGGSEYTPNADEDSLTPQNKPTSDKDNTKLYIGLGIGGLLLLGTIAVVKIK